MSVTQLIRTAISELHQAIELTPFAKGLTGGTLDRKSYCRGLAQLWYIHDAVETAFSRPNAFDHLFGPQMIRTSTILRDLEYFGFRLGDFPVMPQTDQVMMSVSHWMMHCTPALVGALYVLEGSRMGSMFIAKTLPAALQLPEGETLGIEYHIEDCVNTPYRFRNLKAGIDQLLLTEPETEAMVQGAVEFMGQFNKLYEALPVIESVIRNIEISQPHFLMNTQTVK